MQAPGRLIDITLNPHAAASWCWSSATSSAPAWAPALQVFLTDAYLVLVLEYAPCGDLAKLLQREGPLSEPRARFIFQQVLFALEFCHRMVRAKRGGCVRPGLPPSSCLGRWLRRTACAACRSLGARPPPRIRQEHPPWEFHSPTHTHTHTHMSALPATPLPAAPRASPPATSSWRTCSSSTPATTQ